MTQLWSQICKKNNPTKCGESVSRGVLGGDYEEEHTVLVHTNVTAAVRDNLPLQKLSFHKLLIPKALAVESDADSYASAKDGLCHVVCKVLD
jgi:hypothetical protein